MPLISLQVRFYDENDQIITKERSFISKADQRQQLQLPLTAPENTAYMKIGIFNQSEEVNAYFDNLKVTFNDYIVQENHYYPFGMNMVGIEKEGTPDHKFQYNGKEKQEEIGFYDYGARHYDASLGRWFVVDPLADVQKQIHLSPYAYSNNNPIRYNDPTGMIWEDPKKARRLQKRINKVIVRNVNKLARINKKINTGKVSSRKQSKFKMKITEINDENELLKTAISDIDQIAKAPETFRLTGPDSDNGKHGVVKGSNGVINIEGSNDGLHIHEIRHVVQSLKSGGLRFKGNKLLNAANIKSPYYKAETRNNEVNAYRTQYAFDGSFPVSGTGSLKDINETTLLRIEGVNKNGEKVKIYKNLED
ncbi:RHS repeat domain-containing protein [Flammeovirga aprica]|uniref:RHS repeat-associated core domain-containing protein n=1 Tax=Flammeovirga aprica JL-4 TaxID=694437 RepID=A0A7X9S1J5_9BACT|nr:RHS repeat-associated core domain-containing protein [Flammeovirga aprica]NME72564.1 RHS repeat-associated core domain-containing protein [Flammeovirga aprica JL-4]